jgi:hypothetical protein
MGIEWSIDRKIAFFFTSNPVSLKSVLCQKKAFLNSLVPKMRFVLKLGFFFFPASPRIGKPSRDNQVIFLTKWNGMKTD